MLLDIIILVLRETLEAGALISVLLCISTQHKFSVRWLYLGLVVGTACATIYANNFSAISEWFDYAGQEVVNALMQLGIYLCLLFVALWLVFQSNWNHRLVKAVFALIVVLVITRELAEMVIFYTGFLQSNDALEKAVTSGFVGLMIGISFGVICYVAINSWSPALSKKIQVAALSLIAAGMVVQAVQLLMQVDWISSTEVVWDSNWILAESSTFGQMIYAVFGYEATPTLLEVSLYATTVIFMLGVSVYRFKQHPTSDSKEVKEPLIKS